MDSDSDDDFEIAALALLVVGRSQRSRLRRENRKIWVRDIFRVWQQHVRICMSEFQGRFLSEIYSVTLPCFENEVMEEIPLFRMIQRKL